MFIVAGLGFKLGAVPFHMWVPDVYQGAPTAVTLLIGGAPKLAAFAITIRLLVEGLPGAGGRLAADAGRAVGAVDAARQHRRDRADQPQAHARLLDDRADGLHAARPVPGVVSGNTLSAANGYSSAMFYIVTYVLTTLGTFGMIMLLSRAGFEAEKIDDFSGLAQRSPWFAGVMTVFMFSLAGMPPTVGFYAKLAVLQALVSTNCRATSGWRSSAVLLSLVGAFYYLRVVKVMYFDEPVDPSDRVAADARSCCRSTAPRCWCSASSPAA